MTSARPLPMISAMALGQMPQFVLDAAGERALDRVLGTTGLPHRFIERRDGYIPEQMLASFIREAARAVGQQNIGLLWAPFLTVADYGAWGRYVLAAEDLGAALQRATRAMPYHSSTDRAWLETEGAVARYFYGFGLRDHIAYPDIAFSAIGVILSIFREYLGSGWKPGRIGFDFPAPPRGVAACTRSVLRGGRPSATSPRSVDALHRAARLDETSGDFEDRP